MDITKFLSQNFIFESLSKKQLELIEASATIRKLDKGEHLFSEGQKASAFFIVYSGQVKLYKLSAEGTEHILHIQQPKDLVAEAIIFDFDMYPAYCQAIEDTVLIRISKQKYLELLRHFPELSFNIMKAYSRRFRLLLSKIEELSLHDVKARLAKYLIQNSRELNDRRICSLKHSKKDLASVLATIPETLSRTLQFFKKENIIAEEKNQIIILDIGKLKSFLS